MSSVKKAELIFPREWEYRLFCEAGAKSAVEHAVKTLGQKIGKNVLLTPGMESSSRKYVTVRVQLEVDSKAEAEGIAGELSVVSGVKFIM